MERAPEALECYEQATKLKPSYFPAQYGKARILNMMNKKDEAIKVLDVILKYNPHDAEAYFNKGEVLSDLKKTTEAINSFNNAYISNPELSYALGTLVYEKLQICDWQDLDKNLKKIEKGIISGKKIILPLSCATFFDSPYLQKKTAEIWVSNIEKDKVYLANSEKKFIKFDKKKNKKKNPNRLLFKRFQKSCSGAFNCKHAGGT